MFLSIKKSLSYQMYVQLSRTINKNKNVELEHHSFLGTI